MRSKLFDISRSPLIQRMALYAFSDGISKAIPFLVFPLVAYYLTPADFGLVTNFLVLSAFAGPFIGMSTYSTLSVDYFKIQVNYRQKYIDNLFFLNVILWVGVSLLVWLLQKPIGNLSGVSPFYQQLALLIALFTSISGLFSTKLRLDEQARKFGIFSFANTAFSSLMTIIFVVWFRWASDGRILSLVLGSVFFGLLSGFYLLKNNFTISHLDKSQLKAALIFGIPLIPHNLSFWLKSGMEKLVITKQIDLTANGLYSFASTISSIFIFFSAAFFNAFSPYLFKQLALIENGVDPVEEKKKLVKKSYFFLIGYALILLVGYFFSVILIKIFFYQKYGGAIAFLPYLLYFNLFNAMYAIFSGYIFYKKKTKFLGLLTFTTAILQFFLTVFFVKQYGALGAAYATAFIGFLTAILIFWYSNKVFPMPWFKFIKNG